MPDAPLNVLAVIGSLQRDSVTRVVVRHVAQQLQAAGCKVDVKDGRIASDTLQERLAMLVRDLRVYGKLLARQRRADLAGTEPGFLARHRE